MNKKNVCCFMMLVGLIAGFSFFGSNAFAESPEEGNAAVQVEITKGIVNAARLNVRTEPDVHYRVVGQLTLNDEVSILEQNGDWYRIERDGICGWVHGGYIKDLEEQVEVVSKGQQVTRGAYVSRPDIEEVPLIPDGDEGREEGEEANALVNDSEKASEPSRGELVAAEARKHLGKPYSYGSTGPNSFDCSGLVSYCFQSIGVQVPRTSGEYGKLGVGVSAAQALPGDIVCFNTSGKRISHVGIYIGDGQFIHAASGAKTHKVMINHLSESYYNARLVTIRNLL